MALVLRKNDKLAITDKSDVRVYFCDAENFKSVKKISQDIFDDLGRIDSIIINELSNIEEDFITQTANNIQQFMNVSNY